MDPVTLAALGSFGAGVLGAKMFGQGSREKARTARTAAMVKAKAFGDAGINAGKYFDSALGFIGDKGHMLDDMQRQIAANYPELAKFYDPYAKAGMESFGYTTAGATPWGLSNQLTDIMGTDMFSRQLEESMKRAGAYNTSAGLGRSSYALNQAAQMPWETALGINDMLYGRNQAIANLGYGANQSLASLKEKNLADLLGIDMSKMGLIDERSQTEFNRMNMLNDYMLRGADATSEGIQNYGMMKGGIKTGIGSSLFNAGLSGLGQIVGRMLPKGGTQPEDQTSG